MPTDADISEVIRLIVKITIDNKLTEAIELDGASKQVSTGIYQANIVLAQIFSEGKISVIVSNDAGF